MSIRRLHSDGADFRRELAELLDFEPSGSAVVRESVSRIIAAVRQRGDEAVLEFASRFDNERAGTVAELEVSAEECDRAWNSLPAAQLAALQQAAQRIRRYAAEQLIPEFSISDADGSRFGQRVTALDRVGIYVPGGKASYPSSVLMNAIPARVAGVGEIIMVAPAAAGEFNPMVLAAAKLAGVDRIFRLGGAQAIAALAYGTASVPAVDKIVGPGNAYVAAAKREVFGRVGIDMIAGPSEVLIIADESVSAEWLALDLCAQAEHDEQAQALLVSTSARLLDEVASAMEHQLQRQSRRGIIAESLRRRGALIQVADLDEALALANQIAPEHLELAFAGAEQRLGEIRHAGAIFIGPHSAEAFGDYCAGPNHVLPTARTARFASPLGVYDFQKRSSVLAITPAGAAALAPVAQTLARAEGLQAHAESATVRSSHDAD